MRGKGLEGAQRVFALAILFVLVAGLFAGLAVAFTKTTATDPTASDGVTTIHMHDLANGTARLSGLRDVTITSGYTGATGPPPELLGCTSQIRFSINGAAPTALSPTVPMTCTGMNAVTPAPSHTYSGVIPAANLSQASAARLIVFQIEIQNPAGGFYIDDNGGQFYKFTVDISRGHFTSVAPAPVPGSSVADAVTPTGRPNVAFVVQDNPDESPIDFNSLSLLVDGNNQTDAFNCQGDVTGYVLSCALDYDLLAQDFNFTEGHHSVVARGHDTNANAFNESRTTLNFTVDKTPPVVSGVTATPIGGVPGTSTSRPISARGAFITVKANVTDPNLNLNQNGSALAYLFNKTMPTLLPSPAVPMHYNATTHTWETDQVQVPLTWPELAFNVSATVIGVDQAGHAGIANSTSDQFQLDAKLPVLVETPPPGFIKDVPTTVSAKITDKETGVDPASVKVRFSNLTGKFKSPPTGVTKINNYTFEGQMTRSGTTDNYTFTIPAAEGGSVITYQISAKDRAGGPVNGTTHALVVDVTGPAITEVGKQPYHGNTPFTLRFLVLDAGAGLDNTTAKLYVSLSGSFNEVPLTLNATTLDYEGIVAGTVADGQQVKYYVQASDRLGNAGNLGTASAPQTATIDLVPPTISAVTSPASTSASTFNVTWTGTDTRSGVDYYTLQARINDGTPGEWLTIAPALKASSFEVCASGGHTYEFRVSGTDKAGNTGTMPSSPQTSTQLSGAGCEEKLVATLLAPHGGETINAHTAKVLVVRWSASSTRSFTPSSSLRVDVLFSPDGSFYKTIAANIPNDGSYSLNISDLPSCSSCRVQIGVHAISGAAANATSAPFRITQGSEFADLDGNGLPDSWEIQYVGAVGQLKPGDDNDKDGLTNLQESSLGTDPNNKDTDGDGYSDKVESRAGTNPLSALEYPTAAQARTAQFTNWYWSVPGLFLAVAILFFIGLARRW